MPREMARPSKQCRLTCLDHLAERRVMKHDALRGKKAIVALLDADERGNVVPRLAHAQKLIDEGIFVQVVAPLPLPSRGLHNSCIPVRLLYQLHEFLRMHRHIHQLGACI